MNNTAALSAEHMHELQWDSCITPSVITERGYRTLTGTGSDRDELESLGFRPYVWNRDEAYPMLLIPMHGADGTVRGHQVKPASPRMRQHTDKPPTPIKYETPAKAPLMVDVPAFTREAMRTEGQPLWITEGMKKTDALVSAGVAALGMTGVFNWRNSHGSLGDWEDIPLKGRTVILCFDADAAGNRNVQLAMTRLGAWLRTRGVLAVKYIVVPPKVGETEVKGVDDYFAAGGTLTDLAEVATTVPPGAGEKDAAFTDAFLVEELAEVLQGRFCWAAGLGWLRWNGRIWKEVPDVEPLEAVRVWASEQFDKVLTAQKTEPSRNLAPQIAGWRAILTKARLSALRDLAKGLLQRDPAEFDGDPDLLTVGNGTLHLPSGRLLPFDPEHCITKSADADFEPGRRHPMWEAALLAIPGDMHEWYQDRLGQALTGYPTPDHTLVIAHGTGANGKSTVMNTVRRTLGDYGVLISDRVLMASPDAHPTELMDLRGARYALMEETPDGRYLNVQRLKQTLGSESIRARRIAKDTVEFLTSHSLFINTNYKPIITETDWGTWRRLSLMPFPFTYRKASQPLESPWDRRGDPALAYAANDPLVRSAALWWMAEGARAWYARGRMMLATPERVERETRDWRAETDLILGFSDECLRFDKGAFTQTQTMLQAFNDWAGERGHRPWNDRTFASRFGSHDIVRGAKVQQGRFSVKGKQQRGWSGVEIRKGDDPFTGEMDVPPTEWDQRGPGVPGGWTDELAAADELTALGQEMFPEEYQGPSTNVQDRPETSTPQVRTPIVLGFDLETASAEQLFTGGHEGPFVRLAGVADGRYNDIVKPEPLQHLLMEADTIYGHNILGFDIPALVHHHGADYDALAAKAWDTQVAEVLVDPPLSKGMPNGYYKLDTLAERYGVAGKTHDLKALAAKHGGYDRIPVDDQDYNDYLRGDLAATKGVYEAQRARVEEMGLTAYAEREMRVLSILNRMTVNGWAVDPELLAQRVAEEEAKRQEAITILNRDYGVPLAAPDRFKLKKKADWPVEWRNESVGTAREALLLDPAHCVEVGLAERIPGEVHKSPWANDEGKEAIIAAFAAIGAHHVPRSAKNNKLLTSADALGEKEWWDKNRKRMVKGMLHPDVCARRTEASNVAVRALCEVLALATGARAKYAEIARYVTAQGRVHSEIGAAQGSGRRATNHPSNTNMGIRGAAGEERGVLVADPGHVLLTCDLSQVDMRAVAALSQDPEYMKLFEPGRDAHTEMAEVYFGDRSKESRQKTKAINHKFNYGGGVKSTAEMNGLDINVVQRAYNARSEAYPRVMEWLEEVREEAASGRLLDNGFGRLMRPDPERAHTQGPALMGQGAARDIMCESLLRLVERAPHVTPYLRGVVHDEVILSVPEEEVGVWSQVLQEAFTWEWRGVPILCEVGTPAFRWSDCK